MYKYIFLLTIFISISYAKSYTLYLASTKYLDVAKTYYQDAKLLIPDFHDLVIRTHEKKNYSLIIRYIPTIEETKEVQKTLLNSGKYKDSYIKMYETEPFYDVINTQNTIVKEELVQVKKEPIQQETKKFKQEVEDTNEYITASTMFNINQFDKSYEMFYKLFLKHNHNKNINYFLARSAYNIKRHDEATAAYERVLILEPNFHQARYDYARILYKLKQKEEAKTEFNKLLDSDIKDTTKTKIKEFLKVLNTNSKRPSITAKLAIGFNRSSNVNNGLSTQEYLPGIFGEKPIKDNAISEMVNVNFLNYSKDMPMRIKNSLLVYNKNYFNERDEDITVLSYKPSLTYINKKRKEAYSLELTADKIIRETDEDFYAFAISPKLRTKDYETYLKYQRIMYTEEENEEKDFDRIQFYGKVNLFKYMNFYTNIYKDKRIKDLRTDIDRYTIGNGINLFYNITDNDKLNLNYQFDYSKYKYKETIFFNSNRKDKKHTVELSLNHKINKTSLINISTSYTKNNSNQDAYEYDEKDFKLNYLKAFSW